jgi:SAM-dependent methyltransferase
LASTTDLTTTLRWHDLECGSYTADLALWRELATATGGPVLDVGCGAGRVSLDLAREGHAVTGLDHDPELVAALRERADDLGIATVCADARLFSLDRRYGLVIVPMQTVQLLGGEDGRAALLACARAHLQPGGLFAAALTDELQPFCPESDHGLPLPDMLEDEGWVYSSQPVAVERESDRVAIRRHRQAVGPGGELEESDDVIHLDRVEPEDLRAEGIAAGFVPLPDREIAQTDEHVGSTVVVLRARA